MEKFEIDLPLGEGVQGRKRPHTAKSRPVKGRRQPTAREMRIRRRRRKRRIRRLTAAVLLAAMAVAVLFGVVGVVKLAVGWIGKGNIRNTEVSHMETTTAQQVAQTQASDEKETQKIIPYPSISSQYVEISDAAVKTPYIALLDVEKCEIIAGRDCRERIYPASMTKVMTLIVAVEQIKDLEQTYTMGNDILYPLYLDNASVAGFLTDEEVSAKDLLYGLILPSGADAAEALARMAAGSEAAFAELMNKKCRELGLKNTNFTNATGLHDEQQYTTPVEMAVIMDYAMKNPTCAKVLSEFQYTTAATQQHPEGILLTNTMFSRMYGTEAEGAIILAGKTGYTNQAGNCLVSYAARGDRHYIAVTAGAHIKWHPIFDDFALYQDYAK